MRPDRLVASRRLAPFYHGRIEEDGHRVIKKQIVNGMSAKKSIVTIGVFDGVHIGHRAVIKNVVKRNRGIIEEYRREG